ncbi:DUF3168 domain-containing protein [Delftia tsuruhatensis]|uniref:DUF3168 domain-containing protein n=1 Tax=Delftia tsuruhatensis TaxID=180282 RepID=A0ABM6E6I1_9BURK|nr:DUF3168 domain-containing protein [Delftia tsuruhatensis]AOV02755.1 hypothetical protein BI380_16125 [Delftia tsuruhatensis]
MTQLTVSQQITAALAPIVAGRCYQRTFLQPGGKLPEWPAVRFVFVSASMAETICGDGGDEAADYRVQIDLANSRKAGEVKFQELRAQILAAMAAIGPTFVWAGQSDTYDAETDTNRAQLDFMVYQSN